MLLPTSWTTRGTLGLRAKVRGASAAASVAGGLGMAEIVAFTWEAALGSMRLTRTDLAVLERSAAAKQQLVRLRGAWVEVDAATVAALLRHAGERGEGTVAELVRAGPGMASGSLAAGVPVIGVAAKGVLGALIDGALDASINPSRRS